MLVCQNCNHEQEVGKFCAKCGTATVEASTPAEQQMNETKEEKSQESVSIQTPEQPIAQEQTAATVEQSNVNSQQTVEVTKQALGQYWEYFLFLLKNPARAFNLKDNHFIYGLVNIGIYAIAFSLSLYFLGQSYVRKVTQFSIFSGGNASIPFFRTNLSLIMVMIVLIAVLFFSAFIVIKLAKSKLGFKTLVAQFGGLIVPFVALNVIAILGALIGSTVITLLPIYLSVLVVFVFIPVIFTYERVNQINSQGQKVYFSLLTVVLIFVFSLILGEVILMNMIENLERTLPGIF